MAALNILMCLLSRENRQPSFKAKAEDEHSGRKRHLDFLDILIAARYHAVVGLTDKETHNTTRRLLPSAGALAASICIPALQDVMRDEVDAFLALDDDHFTCEIIAQINAAQSRFLARPLMMEGNTLPAGQVIDIQKIALNHNPAVWGDDHYEINPRYFSP
ncbi:cytochrome P450 4X1-like [Dreissena polymorpha]|uniref:cytochrome P450 4X1-like n=1 Tax=Dreissena polymorpha TaxID=45954 RepID=UPI0022655D49|nr:cytochrome P450 4X1-like [Dreissena polymorpha]